MSHERRDEMKANVGKERFGPWALITGGSSEIGREFARQLAKAGLNTVLVARRRALLEEAGGSLAKDFGVQYRVITAEFSQEGFVETLANSTDDLDIGLVVSNAIVPASVTRTMMAKMFEKSLATKPTARRTAAKRSERKLLHACCCSHAAHWLRHARTLPGFLRRYG